MPSRGSYRRAPRTAEALKGASERPLPVLLRRDENTTCGRANHDPPPRRGGDYTATVIRRTPPITKRLAANNMSVLGSATVLEMRA
jgi:hypothetical protein